MLSRFRPLRSTSVVLLATLLTACAQTTSGSSGKSSSGGAIAQLVIFGMIGLGMYFVLIRPQRRRMRDAQQLLSALGDGDEVITTGGIYGFINAIDGDTVWLDIAEGVEIRVHRSAISRRIDPAKEPAGGGAESGGGAIVAPEPDPAPEADASQTDSDAE